MTRATKKQIQRAILNLNTLAMKGNPNPGSALAGLEFLTAAFAGLLDVYAQPNTENPQGMCDDPREFRKHFADLLITLPVLKKRTNLVGVKA